MFFGKILIYFSDTQKTTSCGCINIPEAQFLFLILQKLKGWEEGLYLHPVYFLKKSSAPTEFPMNAILPSATRIICWNMVKSSLPGWWMVHTTVLPRSAIACRACINMGSDKDSNQLHADKISESTDLPTVDEHSESGPNSIHKYRISFHH